MAPRDRLLATCLAATLSCAAFAGDGDEPPGNDAFRQGYRQGYDEGFRNGYDKAMREMHGAAVAAPVPPPPTRSTGPITISRAVYGSSAHTCDATRWAARHANGRMTATLDASNDICGDPSPKDRKSLDVTYVCGTIAKTANAFEHRSLYLDCTP
jgi:hypothetical protein